MNQALKNIEKGNLNVNHFPNERLYHFHRPSNSASCPFMSIPHFILLSLL